MFSVETVERFVSESHAQLAETAKVAAFLPVLTERFARERLRALAQVQGAVVSTSPRSCSSASTTPGGPRWQPAFSTTMPGKRYLDWQLVPKADTDSDR